MNKLLYIGVVLLGISCKKENYVCTCVTVPIGYATETFSKTIKDTKHNATTTCKNSNYTSVSGDVTTTCTLN